MNSLSLRECYNDKVYRMLTMYQSPPQAFLHRHTHSQITRWLLSASFVVYNEIPDTGKLNHLPKVWSKAIKDAVLVIVMLSFAAHGFWISQEGIQMPLIGIWILSLGSQQLAAAPWRVTLHRRGARRQRASQRAPHSPKREACRQAPAGSETPGGGRWNRDRIIRTCCWNPARTLRRRWGSALGVVCR